MSSTATGRAQRPGAPSLPPVAPPFRPDHEHRRDQQEEEDDPDLQQHQPPDELIEVAECRVRGGDPGSREHVLQRPLVHHSGLLSVTMAPCPAPSSARMVDPARSRGPPGYGSPARSAWSVRGSGIRPAAGSQTAWSAIGTTSTGTVTEP